MEKSARRLSSSSRSSSRTKSPPRRRDDRWRSRSPPRRPHGSSRRKYSLSPDRRFDRSPQHRPGRSPERQSNNSYRRSHSRSPRRRVSRSPPRRSKDARDWSIRSPQRAPSRSPPRRRRDDRPKNGGGGFRWKEKGSGNDRFDKEDERRLERGYRNQEKKRAKSPVHDIDRQGIRREKPVEQPKKEKKIVQNVAPAGETIIVNANDRLGTKVSIPCLASDPIKLFKAMVAARIGRQPHEIMLKRQGERPFKDQLTLEDYGISNGVQLDLEVDTGD